MGGTHSYRNRFPLPENHTVTDRICAIVTIPNDPEYISIFRGLVETLAYTRSFMLAPTGNAAREVADSFAAAFAHQDIQFQDCGMPRLRLNPDNCLLEVDCNNDPEAPDWKAIITQATDPRTDITYPPPYSGSSPDDACLSAANIAEWVWYGCDFQADRLDGGALFTALIAGAMSIVELLFTVASEIVVDETNVLMVIINPATIRDDFDALDKQDFIDLLVCYLNPDGSFANELWGDFLTALTELGAGNQAWYLVRYICVMMGYGGASIAALVGGVTSASCGECWWHHVFDPPSELPDVDFGRGSMSAAGCDFDGAIWYGGTYFTHHTPTIQLRRIRVEYTVHYGSVTVGLGDVIKVGGATVLSIAAPRGADGDYVMDVTGSWDGTPDVYIQISSSGSPSPCDGSLEITKITFYGEGSDPYL